MLVCIYIYLKKIEFKILISIPFTNTKSLTNTIAIIVLNYLLELLLITKM